MKKKQKQNFAVHFKRWSRKSYAAFSSLGRVVSIAVLPVIYMGATDVKANTATDSIHFATSLSEEAIELDEIVVSATKVELPLNLAAKQVTVITKQEIQRSPVQSVQDLLNYVAGVDVLQRSPHGVQADISLRGGSFDQVAILLNGVNLTNPQTGHYSFDIPINLSDIERIEIVQGPSSLVYGASAFSGGINIITKKDTESNVFAQAEGGMYGLFGTELRGAYKAESSVHSLSAGYKRADGDVDNSDYNIVNALLQSRFTLSNANIDFQAGINDKKYGANTFYSAAYPNQYDDTRRIFASVRGETYGKLKFIPQMYWSRFYEEFQLVRGDSSQIPYNNHRSDVFGMNLNMQYTSSLGITSFGSEFRNEEILSSVLGKPLENPVGKYTNSDSRTNISYFAEHNFLLDKFTLSLGGLLNHNTALADKFRFFPAVNASYRAMRGMNIYASWNQATRMPTFTDLYYTTATHTGYANLEAELSEAFELGAKYSHGIVRANFAAFYIKGRNMIDWIKEQPDALWESRNHTKVDRMGFDTSVSLNLAGRIPFAPTLTLGYAYIHQNVLENELISNYTLNHLRHKFTANLYHEVIRNLTLSWHFRWQERAGSYVQYVDLKPAETVHYKPFGLLDI
ncbi:MAG: TonB-dependent receptor, partial [Prevotellaceae bacterium]|nr:TonB-dependent receptor [Prevotellaceae bacterium]